MKGKKVTGKIAGVDFGSQLAGTTVICGEGASKLSLFVAQKGQSADLFLLEHFRSLDPCYIGIDAPLSLPGVYQKLEDCSDYHYRLCDRELKAMSPMFLGGLTARAMKLKNELEKLGHVLIEVYPAALLRILKIKSEYKTVSDQCVSVIAQIKENSGLIPPESTKTSHDVDAFLAFISARRSFLGHAKLYGDLTEGLITV